MATTKVRSKKRPFPVVRTICITAVLLVVLFGVLEATNVTHFFHGQSPVATKASGPTPAQKKQQADIYAQQKKAATENPPSTTQQSTPVVDASEISLTAQKGANNSVTVFTNVGAIGNGTCTLTVTNGANSTTQTAAVIYQPQYSTCAGFSVPITSVGTGTWTMTLNVTSNGTTATKSLTQEIN